VVLFAAATIIFRFRLQHWAGSYHFRWLVPTALLVVPAMMTHAKSSGLRSLLSRWTSLEEPSPGSKARPTSLWSGAA